MSKNGPYEFSNDFYDFALMPKFEDNIEYLKNIVEPEDWNYKNTSTAPANLTNPILKNYIRYTYQRIAEEKKIAVTADEEFCCWNTGLITPNQEPVYILFEKNKLERSKPYWHFNKFCRHSLYPLIPKYILFVFYSILKKNSTSTHVVSFLTQVFHTTNP